MRILHVDPAPEWRGGERQVFLLARELGRRGHDAPVVADPRGPLFRRVGEEGLSAIPLRIRGDLDPGAILALAQLLRREPPDVLHLHTARAHAAGGVAARLAGFQPVLVTRRLELPPRGMLGRWKYRALGDHFVAISGAVEESLVRAGIARERIARIPSGVEVPPERGPRPARPWTVGTLAAFTPQKDPETWRRTVEGVCATDAETRFVWAGSGELRRPLEVALASAGLGPRVSLPGFLDDPDRDFWPGIDVLFLPSAFEALGTVLLDALARGIPVVATEVGGIPEIVRSGREGLLAAPGDAPALALALGRLRDDPEEARRMGRAGRERARAFEIGGVVDETVALYGRLCLRRRTVKGRALAAALALACAGGTARGSEPASVPPDWGVIPPPLVIPDTLGAALPFGPAESWAPPPPDRPQLPDELPFGPGERLEFSIDYGFINAGGATMVVERTRNVSGRECLDIRTEAKSNSVFSKIYKVWDRAQTFLEVDTLLPRRFEKHQREGSYKKDAVVKFDREEHFARYENGDEIVILPWAQDELSAFYYVRMLPLEVGREVFIDNHSNRKNYPLKVIVHRRETIEVGAGKFDCLVIEPVIREGGIFSAKGTLTIWITDDARRMPVKMTTKVVVGSISATLQKYRPGTPVARKAS